MKNALVVRTSLNMVKLPEDEAKDHLLAADSCRRNPALLASLSIATREELTALSFLNVAIADAVSMLKSNKTSLVVIDSTETQDQLQTNHQ